MQRLAFSLAPEPSDEGTGVISGLHSFSRPLSVSDRPDQFAIGTQLRSRFYEIGARFLLTELKAGHALLDVADTSQNGTLNAPFNGIHGWYWENTTAQPVTVSLSTAGFYNLAHEFRTNEPVRNKSFP
jgi:hypothetical protein